MPAKSRNQAIAAAIAKHNPGKLYARNQGMRGMSDEQLDEYASTKRKGLPKRKKPKKKLHWSDKIK